MSKNILSKRNAKIVGSGAVAGLLAVLMFSQVFNNSTGNENLGDIDHIALVMQWGPAFAARARGGGNAYNVYELTIHGLWPQTPQGRQGPTDCSHPNSYDSIKQDSNLMKRLNVMWISYGNQQTDYFRSKQWSRHGTCCKNIRGLETPKDYFEKALQLTDNMGSLRKKLERANIHPNDRQMIKTEDFRDALDNSGAKPHLRCNNGLIEEVMYCYRLHTFQPFTCPQVTETSDPKNCGHMLKFIESKR